MLPILFIYKHIMNGGNLLKKLFLTYILIIIIISLLIPSGKNNYLSIHTIDVGQGDSILIQTPNSKNILIDGGDDNSHNIVSSYLKKQNVKRIDYIIATHFDSDHIGGLDNIIDKFNVSNIYAPNYKSDTISYQNLISSCVNKNLNLQYLKEGDFINIEDNINNIHREIFGGKTPYELTREKYPELIDLLNSKYIEPDKVTLNPKDIFKG